MSTRSSFKNYECYYEWYYIVILLFSLKIGYAWLIIETKTTKANAYAVKFNF